MLLLNNDAFKPWLHLILLINAHMPLIDERCTTPIDCEGCSIDTWVFPICCPQPDDFCSITREIKHHLLPFIDCVIGDYNNMFVHHNVAQELCKDHAEDIAALLLFNHLKLALFKEDGEAQILV
jgi:hypothetical protein